MVDAQHYSPELVRFLGEDEAAEHDEGPDTNNPFLGNNLDITTSVFRLEGVTQELDQFRDHEVLRAILDGSDPKEFGRLYESKLRQAELESIQDYITESDNLVQLHAEIRACDDILASMEELLGKFQGNLGSISSEIRSLQEHSQTMSVKLKNRKITQEKLGTFIDHIAVPAPLINTIVLGDVDESFLSALESLSAKLKYCDTDPQAKAAAALKDVAPELERLRAKAVAKSRDYLMQRIYSLRKDKTNIQILQQNVLLKYKYLVTFLHQHGHEVYDEVRAAYVDTLSRVLSSKFKAYIMAIEKLQVSDVATAADLVGNPDVTPSGMMSMFSRGGSTHHKADIFALANRGAILGQLDSPAIIPHIEESKGEKYHFEVLFRSLHKLAMDTGTTEFLFCNQFFPHDASIFHEVLQPTLQVLQSHLETFLQETHDMLCVLLMIRINNAHSNMMGRRKVQCLDDYLDRLKLLLWPKMKAMFDSQLESLRVFNPSQHPWNELKVHYITERYAQLTASMLTLNSDGKDSPLDTNIDRMKASMIELLLRLSRAFPKKKHATILLLLNFSYVLSVLQDAAQRVKNGYAGPTPSSSTHPLGASGAGIEKEFEDQASTCTTMYVEEVLTEHFGRLVAFVKKAETAQKMAGASEGSPVPNYGPTEAAPVVKEFTAKWSGGMEALHKEVMKDFSSAASCGREVLKAAMTQLLLYYTRLLEMLKRSGPEGQALVRDAVTVPSIMYDIRRYNKA